ncbi:MAG: nitronate monooxygenase [Thermoanaerobaculia bacterium]|nr:nitronate monooxygenase [Thermoanaerobaculia bacterium]MBP9824988.1 nitronate monooxygenase [Thermoanaerobaculia bacterium]
MHEAKHPEVIQGGMGVGVSGWRLARAVAAAGGLGVVSGTALDVQLARRLQLGDKSGDLRRSMARFPYRELVDRVLKRYFVAGGIAPGARFAEVARHTLQPGRELLGLNVLASFIEVDLAREGHDGTVGINLLQKIVLPTLPTLYGAMLAGVGYVLMGAGIPIEIPAALEALSGHRPASLSVPLTGDTASDETADLRIAFDPAALGLGSAGVSPALAQPFFLPIISSASLAQILLKRATGPAGSITGFIVEAPAAGGHNAPPRGAARFDALGQPLYGPRDEVDLAKLRELGKPFWLAGSRGRPGALAEARRLGAHGIQVGTAFAFTRESGLDPALRRAVIARVEEGFSGVRTDPRASPTGFPFKVVDLPGTLSEEAVYEQRERVCNLGFLRSSYRREDGGIGYRCAAEPVEAFVAKGGEAAQTVGRKCLCNSLLANVSLAEPQIHGAPEPPLLTAGDDLDSLRLFLPPGERDYGVDEVLAALRSESTQPA